MQRESKDEILLNRVRAMWSVELNGELPKKIYKSSTKDIFFNSECNHTFMTSIRQLIRSDFECRVCNGLHFVAGVNDAATLYPQLTKFWSKDNLQLMNEISSRDGRLFKWECENGHETEKNLKRKADKPGCGICLNRYVVRYVNDLETTNPELAKLWSPNNDRKSYEITVGSGYRAKWICEYKHEWVRTTVKMTLDTSDCPICKGYTPLIDVNTVAVIFPKLISLWSSKNKYDVAILSETAFSSSKKFWWECFNGHSTYATALTRSEFNCGTCKASKGELELGDILKEIDPELVRSSRHFIKPYELDIYMPNYLIAIEYNGDYWHSDGVGAGKKFKTIKEYHEYKLSRVKDLGFQLFFVWESQWKESKTAVLGWLNEYIETGKIDKRLLLTESPTLKN